MRSALILGSVLLNLVSASSPGSLAATPKAAQPALQPVPVTPVKVAAAPRHRLHLVPTFKAPLFKEPAFLKTGLASWYGKVLNHHRTASGEIFDSEQLTAASNTLPMGTRVNVTNLKNGRSVTIRINDRGILAADRIIDLSAAAAERIGLLEMGIAPVQLDVIPATL